jgi:hypothetical protein
MDVRSQTNIHPDYQPTSETDVILRSTNGTHFYLEKSRLKYCCAGGFPAASEMSESSTPGSANPDMVDMTDADAESLAVLLQYMYPQKQPDLSGAGLDALLRALGEAYRYQIHFALPFLTDRVKCVASPRHISMAFYVSS